MAAITLSVPSVLVNNVPFAIVPNTFEYEPGFGEINVRSASAGGGSAVSVHSENAENKIGMCKFSLFVTDNSRGAVREWKANVAGNVVQAVQNGSSPVVFEGMSVSNNPTFAATADGVVEIEFKGDPTASV